MSLSQSPTRELGRCIGEDRITRGWGELWLYYYLLFHVRIRNIREALCGSLVPRPSSCGDSEVFPFVSREGLGTRLTLWQVLVSPEHCHC